MDHWYKTAQEEPDIFEDSQLDSEDDLIQTVVRDIVGPETKQINTTSCETIYNVEGEKLRLWIIVGGTPALSFEDYSFTERYPITDPKWSSEWSAGDKVYPHQDPKCVQGPTYDVLPEGKTTLRKFIDRNLPLKKLRERRSNALPVKGPLVSKKALDKTTRSYKKCSAIIQAKQISKVYGDTDRLDLFDPWWNKYNNFISPIAERAGSYSVGVETLTDDEFIMLVALLREGIAAKAFKIPGS